LFACGVSLERVFGFFRFVLAGFYTEPPKPRDSAKKEEADVAMYLAALDAKKLATVQCLVFFNRQKPTNITALKQSKILGICSTTTATHNSVSNFIQHALTKNTVQILVLTWSMLLVLVQTAFSSH
jgi:hypothetical protein